LYYLFDFILFIKKCLLIMNLETNVSSGSNRTAADTTAAELLAAMASDSLLGKRSSDNTPSNSTKRTQSSSSSSSSQRPAVNEVDSADEREGDDLQQRVDRFQVPLARWR
jgi:hypothetical protein